MTVIVLWRLPGPDRPGWLLPTATDHFGYGERPGDLVRAHVPASEVLQRHAEQQHRQRQLLPLQGHGVVSRFEAVRSPPRRTLP